MEEEKQLIEIKQLPIIEEQLQKVSGEIEQKVNEVLQLVCNEDTVKTIKNLRAELNKEYQSFETRRKTVKEEVLKPYNDFEDIYKKYISDQYRNADVILKGRIQTVEDEIKQKITDEVKSYFEEYKESLNIDFVGFEDANINIIKSVSMKKLKEQCKEFLDKVADDIQLINSQKYKTEILVEYKQNLNVSKSIQTVLNRNEMIKKEAEIRAKQEQEQKEEVRIEVKEVENSVEKPIEDIVEVRELEMLTMEFKVQGTIEQLRELKESINEIGLEIIK